MAASSEKEMEKLEDYFSDVEVLDASFSEMEIGLYFIWLNVGGYLDHWRVLWCKHVTKNKQT